MKGEITGHTGLRGIGAFIVFITHAHYQTFFASCPIVENICSIIYCGDAAVDLFFVLSGFILNYIYGSVDLNYFRYMKARVARLFPLYYAGMFFAILLIIGSSILRKYGSLFGGNLTVEKLFRNLFLIQQWPFLSPIVSINIPEWSISVEMFLYIFIFPMLIYLFKRIKNKYAYLFLLLICMIFSCFALRLRIESLKVSFINNPDVTRGIFDFSSGFIICEIYRLKNFVLPKWLELFCLITTAILIIDCHLHYLLPALFPIIIFITCDNRNFLSRAISSKLALLLGTLSYSIYILHFPILQASQILFKMRPVGYSTFHQNSPIVNSCMFVLFSFTSVFVISWLSYYYFEQPMRKFIRAKF